MQKIRFFRRRIPAFECVPGCHDCCGPVTASSEEMFDLPTVSDARRALALDSLSCPHLGPYGCTVYASRPLICRAFGTTPTLPCPRGRSPARLIDPQLDRRIQHFLAETRQVLV